MTASNTASSRFVDSSVTVGSWDMFPAVIAFQKAYSAIHPQVYTRTRVYGESSASHVRVQLESVRVLDTSAIASVTRIPVYGIATDDYISFKLLIVTSCFFKACKSLLHLIESYASRVRVKRKQL